MKQKHFLSQPIPQRSFLRFETANWRQSIFQVSEKSLTYQCRHVSSCYRLPLHFSEQLYLRSVSMSENSKPVWGEVKLFKFNWHQHWVFDLFNHHAQSLPPQHTWGSDNKKTPHVTFLTVPFFHSRNGLLLFHLRSFSKAPFGHSIKVREWSDWVALALSIFQRFLPRVVNLLPESRNKVFLGFVEF